MSKILFGQNFPKAAVLNLEQPKWSVPSISRDVLELGYHVELDNLEDPGNAMPSKIKPFRCSACDASFNMKCFLNMHVRKVHGNDKDVQNQQMT